MEEKNGNQPSKEGTGKSPLPAPVSTAGAGTGGGTGIVKILLSGITSALGLRRRTDTLGARTSDVSTRLAHERTDLAMDRNYLAADRTLMAWIRTALSMISFGFTIGKLGQVMENVEVKTAFGRTKMMSVESIAYFLTILGTVSLLGAAFQHWIRMRQLRAMGCHIPVSLSFIVALVLAVVGGFALSSLILAL
jgi:putative membrane protein